LSHYHRTPRQKLLRKERVSGTGGSSCTAFLLGLGAGKQRFVCANAGRPEWQTVIRANGDNLRANLNKPGEKNWILAGGIYLADEAHAGALRNVELGETQKARVTKVDLDIAASGLQQDMSADWRCLRIFRKAQHRTLQRDIFRYVIGARSWLSRNSLGTRPLRKGRTCASGYAHYSYKKTGFQEQLH